MMQCEMMQCLKAVPNPGADIATNTRVKLVTNAHIGHAPPVSIKNILEGVNYITLTIFATLSLATILPIKHAEFP